MPIKAALFDFMGTCLDWHSSVVSALPFTLSASEKSHFALEWRQAYFDYNDLRIQQNKPVEDFDTTLHTVLNNYLSAQAPSISSHFTPETNTALVQAFHDQRAWPDVSPALQQLKAAGIEVYVHANGSTRLQLDLCRSAGLQFNMLFSSQLLDVYKPTRESYVKVLDLLQLKPEECVMVAAHAYDTRGAKDAGIRTVYVYRWTDDIREDQKVVKGENDRYLPEGMGGLREAVRALS